MVILATEMLCLNTQAQRETEPEQLLSMGKAALADGLPTLAEKYFKRYIKKTNSLEDRAEGTLGLAQAYYQQYDYGTVIKLLRKRANWAQNPEHSAGFLYWSAAAEHALERYAAALKKLTEMSTAMQATSYGSHSQQLRARCYIELGQTNAALMAFAEFEKLYPNDPINNRNMLDWAGLLLKTDNIPKATEVLEKLCRSYQTNEAARIGCVWLAQIRADQKQWVSSQALLEPLTHLETLHPEVGAKTWFGMAQAYEGQAKLGEALMALEKIDDYSPEAALEQRVVVSRTRVLIQLGRAQEGLTYLHNWIAQNLSDPQAGASQIIIAQHLLDHDFYELAIQEFQYYLDAFTNTQGRATALLGKGWAFFEEKRFAEAAFSFEKAYNLSTDPAEKKQALIKTADAYFANQQFSLARDKYIQATTIYLNIGEAPETMFQAAECLAKLGEYQQAEKELMAIEDAYPDSPHAEEAALRLAHLQEKQGRWEQAVQKYNRYLTRYPKGRQLVLARHGRGLVLYRTGRFSEALTDFEYVVTEHPELELAEQASYMRGWCLHLLGDSEKALELCENFIRQYPHSTWIPNVKFWLAEYHYNHKHFAEAEQRFSQISIDFPQSSIADDALFWAGQAANAQKEYVRAIDYFNKLTHDYPESSNLPEARFAQGDALCELGQFAGAILAFEEIHKSFPDHYLNNRARGRIGDCHFTLGSEDPMRYEQALQAYGAIVTQPGSPKDLQWQAQYKRGRCQEKLGHMEEAVEDYVILVYDYLETPLSQRSGGSLWFTRAAFSAAAIRERQEKWDAVINIYKRVIEAGVPAAEEARERVQQLRFKQWLRIQ